jgi:hypothetical protein
MYIVVNIIFKEESSMTRSKLFKLAHQNTKEVKKVYPEVNYRCQFGMELKALYGKNNMETKEQRRQRLEKEVKSEYVSEITASWLNVKFENILPALKGSKTLEIVKEMLGGKPASDKKNVENIIKSLIQNKINEIDENRIISLYNSGDCEVASDVITYLLG